MSSLTNPAPTDPADLPWLKVSADVVSDAVNVLRWLQDVSVDPAIVREVAYVRHRLEMAANSQMQPAQWKRPMAAE